MSRAGLWTKHLARIARAAAFDARRVLHDHWMFGLSAVALLSAGAVALGAFGFTDKGRPGSGVATTTELPPVAVSNAPVAPLVLTYYLVESEAQQALLYAAESRMWNREYLQTSKLEVLVARDREEEEAAYREIAAARVRSLHTTVVVEDLRSR